MSSTNENPSVAKNVINWFPGHMAKTRKEINNLLPIIDLVYELVDARIPYSSRIDDIDSIIKNKPRIIIMTKSDLCDISNTKKWVKKYEDMGYKVVLTNLNKDDLSSVLKLTKEMVIVLVLQLILYG